MSALKISIGCDPEMFVRNKATGEFVSAHTLLPGTKEQPHEVNLGAVQVDGVAAEFNIKPALTADYFRHHIGTVMTKMGEMIGNDYELVAQPAVEFPETYFKSLPDQVRELGCNPDFNAWTGQINEKPNGAATTLRTAAGHIHVGWTDGVDPTDDVHFEDCRIVAKQLDYYLGLPSLMWDKDNKRRSLYGKAGAFRPKPYGMEYRSLSNVWLRSGTLQSWIWNSAYKAVIDLIQHDRRAETEYGDAAVEIINQSQEWKTNPKIRYFWDFTHLSFPPALPPEGAEKKEIKSPKVRPSKLKLSEETVTITVQI